MGVETSKTAAVDQIIPESCTLEGLKEKRQLFEDKIKEFEHRLQQLKQTARKYLKASNLYKANYTFQLINQILAVRLVYTKVLVELNGSILLIEEGRPLISLLEMLPHSKTQLGRMENGEPSQFRYIFQRITEILMDSVTEMYLESEKATQPMDTETIENLLLSIPSSTTTTTTTTTTRKDKDKV